VDYEELGNDYPYGYVRWTEQRNMQAFLDLLAKKAINLKPLITHVFDIANAEEAYDIILGKVAEPHIGILLKYAATEKKFTSSIAIKTNPIAKINVGFVGAGSFAQSYLIPNVKSLGASLDTVVTSKGLTAKNVADKFGFSRCSANIQDVLSNEAINTVFIATPHASHANQVVDCLKAGKSIFVEKPLAVNYEQLWEVVETKKAFNQPVMVGFNRRFAPVCTSLKKEFKNLGEPLVINIRVNAGFIPKEHWTQIPEIGAGRVIGEMCHFVDLMTYFTDAKPVKVYAECIQTSNQKLTAADNVAIIIRFDDGSIGNLTYMANGDRSMPKEHIEIFGGGTIGVIKDFQEGALHKKGSVQKIKSAGKGHKEEIEAFINALQTGKEMPIDFNSIYLTTLSTFKIIDSLQSGLPQEIVSYE
jgi:polar amino acid transport system substrate-binding protein